MSRRFSSEFELAVACILPAGALRDERIATLLARGIDWPLMLRVLGRHRIWGLAAAALRPYAAQIPAESVQVLQAAAKHDAFQNLRQAMGSRTAVDALAKQNIPCAVLKGVTVGQLACGTETVRHSRDIDMVVRPEDMWAADAVLVALGYTRVMPEPDWTRERIERSQLHQKHFDYEHDGQKMRLELHARLCNNRFLTSLQFDPARVQMVRLSGCGITLPTLPMHELVLYLCLHGASHAWMRLKWLADVVTLLHTWTADELQELVTVAQRYRLERQLGQAVALTEELCGVALPITLPRSSRVRLATQFAVSILAAGQGADEPYGRTFTTSLIGLSQFLVSHDVRSLAAQAGDLATASGYYSDRNILSVAPARTLGYVQRRTRQLFRKRG